MVTSKHSKIVSFVVVIAMLMSFVPVFSINSSAAAPASYTDIHAGEAKTVTNVSSSNKAYFRFVPTVTGTYKYWSSNYSGDPLGYILDSNGSELIHDDDAGDGLNFYMEYYMYAEINK